MYFFSPETILNHLKIYLPRLTDLFSTNTNVVAEIIAGDPQILRITKANHGLSAGNEVVTIHGLIDNPIVSVQDVGNNTLRFITQNDHDLTYGYTESVLLDGFTDTGLNTTFELYTVPNRNIFEIVYNSVPTLNGNEVLRESWENGINGKFEIDSVTTDTFDILLTGKPTFTTGIITDMQIVDSFRMSIAADFERAQKLYTNQDTTKSWLFVIMDDCRISKDRNIESDASAANTAQNPQRIKMINGFFINTIMTTTDDLAAANASQISWVDIYIYMLSVVSGKPFETFGESNYLSTMISHGSVVYNKGYYAHSYNFEYMNEITNAETFAEKFILSRAYRDSGLSFAEIQDGSTVNLDEEL